MSAQYGASNFPRTVSPNCVDFTRSPYAQRGHDAASTVPSLRSVHPPSPHEVGRRRRREEGVYTKALTHAHRIVRAHIRAEEARWRCPSALSLIGQVGRQAPGTRPTTPCRLTSRTRPRTPSRTLSHIRLQYWKRAARAGEHAAAAAAAAAEQAASPHRLADPSGAVGSSETTAT